MNITERRLASGVVTALLTCAAQAANVTVEPDDYTGVVTHVGPGATLVSLHSDNAGGWTATDAYSVKGGTWAPTGRAVFGHQSLYPGNLLYHWDYLGGGAHFCIVLNQCGAMFFVFGAAFDTPTRLIEVLTTMRGEMAMDPVELAVYTTNGTRLRCRQQGVDTTVLNTGVLPPPRFFDPLHPWLQTPCGEVIGKKNCQSGNPNNCDYVVRMRVNREIGDMAMMMFGGLLYQNTHANVDRLTYWIP